MSRHVNIELMDELVADSGVDPALTLLLMMLNDAVKSLAALRRCGYWKDSPNELRLPEVHLVDADPKDALARRAAKRRSMMMQTLVFERALWPTGTEELLAKIAANGGPDIAIGYVVRRAIWWSEQRHGVAGMRANGNDTPEGIRNRWLERKRRDSARWRQKQEQLGLGKKGPTENTEGTEEAVAA